MPTPLPSTYVPGSAQLSWLPNVEPDLAGYRLYRGVSASFVPDQSNLIGSTSSTTWTDPAAGLLYYKMTAVDVHGNASAAVAISVTPPLGVADGTGHIEFALSASQPNPAWNEAAWRFALPRAGHARLAIYDAAGRELRALVDETRPSGEQVVKWDLRDALGRAVGPGVYFARLSAGGQTMTRRIAVVR